jgi:hypothetical protein
MTLTARARKYGCKRDLRDPRDHRFKVSRGRPAPSIDWTAYAPPRPDQGDTGSCTGQAIKGALELNVIRHGGAHRALSALGLYYDERKIENTVDEDAGAEIRTGIKVAKKIGVGPESAWPYVESRFREPPPPAYYQTANMFGALEYERVPVSAIGLKRALMCGPVVIGVTLFESFEGDEASRDGVIPMPDVDRESMMGGHAMYAVGYNTGGKCPPEHAKIANSWGEGWGDSGFCYMPLKMLGSTEFGGDYWVIKNVGGA